jgi:transcriptional regulator with XRE-family HTH domain
MKNTIVPFDEFYDEFEFEHQLFTVLKEFRVKAGLSQREFAKKIGITQPALVRFERGRMNPTLTFLKKIVLGLGLKITLSKDETMI